MKRLIASRRLKRTCIYCNHSFKKGDVYYKEREVCIEDCEVVAYEYLVCPRCLYSRAEHSRRFEYFQGRCTHPKEFVLTFYRYIPGECVQEPDFNECRLCGKIV